MAQFETILALGNGYLGMRGCPEEGGPSAENSTLVNGFYETRPILYGEEAYGFAKTGQTILNVTDSKIVKLLVDDEPFWLPHANLLRYDRRLNLKAEHSTGRSCGKPRRESRCWSRRDAWCRSCIGMSLPSPIAWLC